MMLMMMLVVVIAMLMIRSMPLLARPWRLSLLLLAPSGPHTTASAALRSHIAKTEFWWSCACACVCMRV